MTGATKLAGYENQNSSQQRVADSSASSFLVIPVLTLLLATACFELASLVRVRNCNVKKPESDEGVHDTRP